MFKNFLISYQVGSFECESKNISYSTTGYCYMADSSPFIALVGGAGVWDRVTIWYLLLECLETVT